MRHVIPLFFIAPLLLAGCSNDSDEDAAGFKPPVNVLRADLVAGFDKRFERLDRDKNGTIEPREVAQRPALIKRYDADNDGVVTRDEFKTVQLKRFDQADVNHDGTLTTAERDAIKDARP
ncbi:hypothetical protein ACVWZA_000733 [Sphingomonas sp. UYAg733]